jgi:hypothetical protein
MPNTAKKNRIATAKIFIVTGVCLSQKKKKIETEKKKYSSNTKLAVRKMKSFNSFSCAFSLFFWIGKTFTKFFGFC